MDWTKIGIGKYYRVWCEIVPIQNNYFKLYWCTTKRIKTWTTHKRGVGIADMYVIKIIKIKSDTIILMILSFNRKIKCESKTFNRALWRAITNTETGIQNM